ncbi:MAG: sulfotransferase [Pseudomonadota bacterium]
MNMISPNQVGNLFKSALSDQSEGNVSSALRKYSEILKAYPKLPEPYFQVGRIELQRHRYSSASAHFERAIALRPGEIAIWLHFARALRLLNVKKHIQTALKNLKVAPLASADKEKVEKILRQRSLPPKPPLGGASPEKVNQLTGLLQNSEYDAALKLGTDLLRKFPDSVIVNNILACAQIQLRDYASARKNLEKAIGKYPNYLEACTNLGRVYFDMGDNKRAIELAEKVRAIDPNQIQAVSITAQVLHMDGATEEAIRLLETVISTKSTDQPDAMVSMSDLYSRAGEHEKAIAMAKALFKSQKSVKAYFALSLVYDKSDQLDKAVQVTRDGIEAHPHEPVLYNRLGALLQVQGDFDTSEEYLRKAIEMAPDRGQFYSNYLTANELDKDHPVYAIMMDQYERTDLPDPSREAFGYAIARVHERAKEYDKVFPYLNAATAIQRKRFPYDIDTRYQALSASRKFYETFDPDQFEGVGVTDFSPIFITGMPRSGTTLAERIVSAHSTVVAGGEDGQTRAFINKIREMPGDQLEHFDKVRPEIVKRIGEVTKEHFNERFPSSDIVTDKAIGTYTEIGLIKAALPNAKFVVLRRDPRDNLLSIYKNRFTQGTHLYSNDMVALTKYYHTFLDYLDMWRELMPGGFYELFYEKLTENPEEETRKLIDYCGLEWEDACLSFHEQESTVRTLSIYQARQPIYKSSVALWENYKEELKPMLEILESRGE